MDVARPDGIPDQADEGDQDARDDRLDDAVELFQAPLVLGDLGPQRGQLRVDGVDAVDDLVELAVLVVQLAVDAVEALLVGSEGGLDAGEANGQRGFARGSQTAVEIRLLVSAETFGW